MKKGKIKISKNSPYIVTGNIPLFEKIITSNNKENEYKMKENYNNLRNIIYAAVASREINPFAMLHIFPFNIKMNNEQLAISN